MRCRRKIHVVRRERRRSALMQGKGEAVDAQHFDELTRALAFGVSRRRVLWALLTGLGATAGLASRQGGSAAAECRGNVACTTCDRETGECRAIEPSPCSGCCRCDVERGVCSLPCNTSRCERCQSGKCEYVCQEDERCLEANPADAQYFGVCVPRCARTPNSTQCEMYDRATDSCKSTCSPCQECRNDECVPTKKCDASVFGAGPTCLECHPRTGNCVPCGPCRPCDEESRTCVPKECAPCTECEEGTGECKPCGDCKTCVDGRCEYQCKPENCEECLPELVEPLTGEFIMWCQSVCVAPQTCDGLGQCVEDPLGDPCATAETGGGQCR